MTVHFSVDFALLRDSWIMSRPNVAVPLNAISNPAGSDGSFKMQILVPTPQATVEIKDEHGNRNSYVLSLETGKVIK